VSAARAALSGRARGAPKGRDGAVEAVRAVMVAKRSARSERTRSINQARALVVTGPDDVRARFGKHSTSDLVADERCSVALVLGVHLFLPGLVWPDRATSSHRLTVGSGTTGAGDAQTCSTSRDRVRRVRSRSPRPLIGFQQGHRNGGEPGRTPSRPAGTR
jgi:transposase